MTTIDGAHTSAGGCVICDERAILHGGWRKDNAEMMALCVGQHRTGLASTGENNTRQHGQRMGCDGPRLDGTVDVLDAQRVLRSFGTLF